MGGKNITPRKLINVPAEDFKKFDALVQELAKKKGIRKLRYTQAFPLIVEAAERKLAEDARAGI